jgi:hypothetical protein
MSMQLEAIIDRDITIKMRVGTPIVVEKDL